MSTWTWITPWFASGASFHAGTEEGPKVKPSGCCSWLSQAS